MQKHFIYILICFIFLIDTSFAYSFVFKSSSLTKEIIKRECEQIKLDVNNFVETLANGQPTVPLSKVLSSIKDITEWIEKWIVKLVAITPDLDNQDSKYFYFA